MAHFLMFILMLFIVATLFRVDFFFYLLYFMFGVYFLSRIWSERALRAIDIEHEYPQRTFPGERIQVKFRIRNRGFLPIPWLRIHESLPVQLRSPNFFRCVLSFLPYEDRTLTYELNCRRRGYYLIGPTAISTGDLFGITGLERHLEEELALLVYPRIHPLRTLGLPAKTPFGQVPTKDRLFEDPTRIIGVRDYIAGDSLRHIHWKTSAVVGRLQVKRFEPAISIEAQILLNLDRGDYSVNRYITASELAIETAASIATYLVEQRQNVGLSCNGSDPLYPDVPSIDLPLGNGRDHLTQILDALARVRLANKPIPFVEVVSRLPLHLSWGGTAIIITPDIEDALFDTCLLLRRSGFHIELIVVDPGESYHQIEARARQVHMQTWQVWREEDLHVWQ